MTEKLDPDITVFSDIFPGVKIQRGNSAANHWSLEGQFNNYLSTSPGGSSTGFGCHWLVLDDLIKSAEEAMNEAALEKTWGWLASTLISRIEAGGKIVVCATFWSSGDAPNRILRWCEEEGIPYKHIIKKAYDEETNTYLCPQILDERTYNIKKSIIGEAIFLANYQATCIDIEGRLYQKFNTYDIAPEFEGIYAYVDTADTGSDNLCAIIFGIYKQEAYILDILYTPKPMTYTEPLLAKMLYDNKVNLAIIESNNGGNFFGKTIQKTLKEEYCSNYTKINLFHQSKNKEARILSNSLWVQDHVYYPTNWKKRFPEFYSDTVNYIAGESVHDDNVDTLSGISEFINQHNRNHYSKDIYERGYGTKTVDFSEYYDRYRLKNVF